jgi:hypothetical protein
MKEPAMTMAATMAITIFITADYRRQKTVSRL